jgi:putative membrane protein
MAKELFLFLKGAAMGVAEVIPGVSGGTIAFITGVYERLMESVKSFSPALIGVYKSDGISGVWKKIDGTFLLWVFAGMGAGLVAGALLFSGLIENYPLQVWGFFFGLILASAIFIFRQISNHSGYTWMYLILGFVIAYAITILSPAEGNTALWYVIVSGMIAITALMMPGISGSFILLLLGMYTHVLSSFKTFLQTFSIQPLLVIIAFGIGCIIGVVVFSRVITWTLNQYRSYTLALLTGFLVGSLNKIWPWRIPVKWMTADGDILTNLSENEPGKLKILKESNVFPADFPTDPHALAVLLMMALGLILVLFLERSTGTKSSN